MPEETILDRIVARRRLDIAEARTAVPEAVLQRQLDSAPALIDFVARLEAAGPMALIAEIKRASPSKGDIAPGINAAEQGLRYAHAGAAAISVLTEPTWFKGTLADMLAVRRALDAMPNRPAILRKDFIIDRYQLLEARAHGADSALLIVASLSDADLVSLMHESRGLGMEPLVEINNADEMQRAIDAGARLIGINNRDLRSFSVDLATTDRLSVLVPRDVLLAALSGISTRADVERFAATGARAVLVGEALMTAPDAPTKARELLGLPAPVPAP